MADDIVVTEQVEQTQVQDTVAPEVRQMMELSLNGGMPPHKTEETQTTETVVEETKVTQTEPPVFQFQTFTEKYGWQSLEDAEKEIQELRTFKANPPKEELKFENEKSQLLVKALQAGEFDKVHSYLDEQVRLDKYLAAEVNEQTADEIIKLGLKLNHKDLTDKEIEFKFNKTYSIPKEPVQGVSEDDEVFAERQQTWREQCEDIKTSKIIDAKLAKPQLEQAKTKLVVPIIEQSVDEDYIQYKNDLEESKKLAEEAEVEYKAFTPKSIEMKLNFNDEANKIQFDFQFEPDEEGFKKTLEVVTNPEKYRERYSKPDGSYDRKRFLEDQYFSMNREKILFEAMKQAKNATMKQTLLADNTDKGIGSKQLPQTQEMSELDKQMKASLNGFLPTR